MSSIEKAGEAFGVKTRLLRIVTVPSEDEDIASQGGEKF
jgi:hypothetical protein